MGKQRQKHPLEENPFAEDLLSWMGSPDGQSAIESIDILWPILEKSDVDAKSRKIIWPDGQRLSILESVQRIHAAHPEFTPDLIEERLIGWLEGGFAPSTYSEEQLDELDRHTEDWIDAHERGPEAAEKRRRTRHS
jgi:hypothetical protein